MTTTTTPRDRNGEYHRVGIAIPHHRKPTMDARLAELDMKTLGDLATFFITCDGLIEVLLPLIPAYREKSKSPATGAQRRLAVDALKGLSTEELQRIVELATQQKATQ